jgi:imidazolonepropionase-like amidohydrolase
MRPLVSLGVGALAGAVGLAIALTPPPPLPAPEPGFELRGVTVLNPGEPALPGRTVRAEGERLASLDPADPAETGEFSGYYVLPGLVDLHVHHPPPFALGERELFALLFLSHGVTSVRDTGALGGSLLHLRERIETGATAGPRIFACGPPLDGEPPTWTGARVVENGAEARAAVVEQAAAGFDCVKLYNGLDLESFRAAEEEASRLGLPVVAHVPDSVAFRDIRSAEVQHVMGLVDSDWDRVPEPLLAHYVRHSVREELSHLPSLVAIARWAELDAGDLSEDPSAQLLPRHYRELLWQPGRNPLVRDLAPSEGSEAAERLHTMKELVGRLHAKGVPVLAGTDTLNPFVVPGASLHEELGHLASAGLTLEEALAAATRLAGRALGRPDIGVLRVGSAADLLVLREDPTRDLAALESLEAVAVAGRLYRTSELEAAVAARLEHAERPWVRGFWGTAARLVLAWIDLFES